MESKFNFKNQESKTQESKESSLLHSEGCSSNNLKQHHIPCIVLNAKDREVTEMQVIVRMK